MSAIQDYSGIDDDSLCYSASITNENDFGSDFMDKDSETLDTKKVVVIFGDGFNPRQQQQHDVKLSQNEQASKPFGRQVHNSRPSNKMQDRQSPFHPKASGQVTFHAPATISLK